MMRNAIGSMLVSCTLAASHVSAADAPRFSEYAETTIGVSVGNQEFTARLWMGRTEVSSTSRTWPANATAIYLPSSKLLWWALIHTDASRSMVEALKEFKDNSHCSAGRGEIVCFGAVRGYIWLTRSFEQRSAAGNARSAVARILPDIGPDVAAHMGRRVAQLSPRAVDEEITPQGFSSRSISLIPVEEIAPLFSWDNSSGMYDPRTRFYVTKAVPTGDGWELNIRNGISGRIGEVILDGANRPVSGKMLKK